MYKIMLSYCLKSRKNTESKNPKLVRTENVRAMLLSKCAVCDSKKSKFLKEQEAKGLLGNLLGTKIPILGDIPLRHLRQLGFTYSASRLSTKNKERIKIFSKTRDSRYIYQNELDKVCFQHDMAYGGFEDLNRRTTADKVVRDKAFNIVKDPKYD